MQQGQNNCEGKINKLKTNYRGTAASFIQLESYCTLVHPFFFLEILPLCMLCCPYVALNPRLFVQVNVTRGCQMIDY